MIGHGSTLVNGCSADLGINLRHHVVFVREFHGICFKKIIRGRTSTMEGELEFPQVAVLDRVSNAMLLDFMLI